jgi:hypothetical protein
VSGAGDGGTATAPPAGDFATRRVVPRGDELDRAIRADASRRSGSTASRAALIRRFWAATFLSLIPTFIPPTAPIPAITGSMKMTGGQSAATPTVMPVAFSASRADASDFTHGRRRLGDGLRSTRGTTWTVPRLRRVSSDNGFHAGSAGSP